MFSNWANTSDWKVIDDPTGVLNGKVLSATSSTSARVSEILLQNIGTSTAFDIKHYSIICNYAFQQDWQFSSGSLEVMSRVSYVGSDVTNCYFSRIDVAKNTISIGSIKNGTEKILVSSSLESNFVSKVFKHKIEFRTFGTTSVTLELYIDDVQILSSSDNSATVISSGFPAISVKSGTIFIDTFFIQRYTIDGGKPTDWTPSNLTSTKALWLKADTGVTITGSNEVSGWADQSGNSNNASAASAVTRPTQLASTDVASLNNRSVIDFDGTQMLDIAHSASLNMNSSGISIFVVINSSDLGSIGNGTIFQKADTLGVQTYAFKTVQASTPLQTNTLEFSGTSQVSSTANCFELSNYQIISLVSNRSAATPTSPVTRYGFWVNGTTQSSVAIGPDSDVSSGVLRIGATSASTQFLKAKIAEMLIISGEVTISDRQLIEGYLAHRHALQANLSSSHPYRYESPQVGD